MRTAIATAVFVTSIAGGLEAQREHTDAKTVWTKLAKEHDKNGDGRITAAEYGRGNAAFANLDRNGDGVITIEDFEIAARRPAPGALPRAREADLGDRCRTDGPREEGRGEGRQVADITSRRKRATGRGGRRSSAERGALHRQG